MSLLMGCGWCCMLLSVWAVIQLLIMGVFFKMEVLAFIEEAEAHHGEYDDFEDFMKKTKINYSLIAVNCWIGALIYFVFIGISWMCITRAKQIERIAAEKIKDIDIFCKERSTNFE